MSFKIEKILLRISHFFNYRLDEEHKDDITIILPSSYPEEGIIELISLNNSYQWIVDDIFDQIYKRFEEDPIFEKKCRNVKYVLTNYHFTHKNGCIYETTRQIPYLDGVLYNPYDHKSYSRQIKLNKLLNNNCNI